MGELSETRSNTRPITFFPRRRSANRSDFSPSRLEVAKDEIRGMLGSAAVCIYEWWRQLFRGVGQHDLVKLLHRLEEEVPKM